jgi:hypothetical protein
MTEFALVKRSTLAAKLEMGALTGTHASSTTAVTGTTSLYTTELVVGDVIGSFANGWRRVVSITDATHLTVDAAFDPALSASTIEKYNYGVDPTLAAANILEFIDPFGLEPSWSQIERNVVRNTFDSLAKITGEETVAGDVALELHGSGTPGTLNDADPFLVGAIGERRNSAAAATHASTPCTTTSLVLVASDGVKFRVGQAILIDVSVGGTGVYEIAWITVITTDTLTISPALSLAPPVNRAIGAGIHFRPSIYELKSLYLKFWRGDITLEKYTGCKVSNMAIDYAVGQTVNPKFTVQGKGTDAPTSAVCTLGAGTFDAGGVHVGRYMILKVGGTLYTVSACAFALVNDLYRQTDLTTSGTRKLIRTKRTVSGSFSLLYENKDIETAFRNGTTAELVLVSSDGSAALVPGNTCGIRFPVIKYTEMKKASDAGIYRYDMAWESQMVAGEDTIFASIC